MCRKILFSKRRERGKFDANLKIFCQFHTLEEKQHFGKKKN